MRLTEGQVRAYVNSLNKESRCRYVLRKAYAFWQLYCEGYEYVMYEGCSGSLREIFEIVKGIRQYLYYERKKEAET